MELRHIRYFLVLCEELHFTRAAERCGVTQPCLSSAIRKMEGELGGVLFHRKPQPQLSDLGRAIRPLWDEAVRSVEHSLALAHGHSPADASAAPAASPVALDEVRLALERIAAEQADAHARPSPADDRGDDKDGVIVASLRDRRIVASCRARSGWTFAPDDRTFEPPPKRRWRADARRAVRNLVFAAVTAMIVAALAVLFGRLTSAKASELGRQATSVIARLMSTAR